MAELRPSCILACVALLGAATISAGPLAQSRLQETIARVAHGFDGRVGVCVKDASDVACLNGAQRFPLQSVMKLIVAVAVLDAVDHGQLRLEEPVVVRREDLSLGVQPIAKLVTREGFRTTIDDLMRRAIVDSDSAAADILIARLGGPRNVQAVLDRLHVSGVRIDRDEKHLQTESWGLAWRPEYVDAALQERAFAAVPPARTDAAFRAYQKDPRDTATPLGMVSLLQSLANGQLLSARSTTRLLDVLGQTVTFPDRLKAGVPAGWTLVHKTGTSGTWRGVTAVTNDVGILFGADRRPVSIAVFIADSRASDQARAVLIANIARVTVQCYP